MSAFLTPLKIEQIAIDRWKLLEPLVYESDLLGCRITVPVGFITDMESVPRWLPIVYALLYGEAHAAGVLHDYLYMVHKIGVPNGS